MIKNPNSGLNYSPQELKTLFEALQIAPSYLSRKFVLQYFVGMTEKDLAENVKMRFEEDIANKQSDRIGGYTK